MSLHSAAALGARHPVHNYSYASAAARLAASGFTSSDIGKVARQTDNNTFWVLVLESPITWHQMDAAGGGGGALEWRGGTSNPSPSDDNEFNQKVFLFAPSSGNPQSLYALVKVPESYITGSQVLLDVDFYSPSTSNNFQMTTVASLIRNGTDAAGSTGNQRTSTPTALTNGSPSNKLRKVVFELTDSSGAINSIAVSAGDEIEVELKRETTDTDTADARHRPDSTSLRFA